MSASRVKRTKTEPLSTNVERPFEDNVIALASARRSKTRRSEPRAPELLAPEQLTPEVAEPELDEIRTEEPTKLDAVVDGRRVTIEADREIVLRCGKSSITLTRSGKIILRGTHVVSRSSGANRVQGSQVRIN